VRLTSIQYNRIANPGERSPTAQFENKYEKKIIFNARAALPDGERRMG
jgi:hypothetical protein